MYLLDTKFRKDLKNNLATRMQDWIDYFVDDKYDNKLVAFLIRACHLHTPVYCMIGMVNLPFFFATWIYIWVFLVFFMFIYLRGCFLSVTEFKLSDEDITIADPVEERIDSSKIIQSCTVKYHARIIHWNWRVWIHFA